MTHKKVKLDNSFLLKSRKQKNKWYWVYIITHKGRQPTVFGPLARLCHTIFYKLWSIKNGEKNWHIMFTDTWNVDWITYTFGYILHRSCWPSFVRICCTIKSMATWLSPPRGMITSAYFFDGRTKSSNAGLTNFAYYKSQYYKQLGTNMQCDWSHLIRKIKLHLLFTRQTLLKIYKFVWKSYKY